MISPTCPDNRIGCGAGARVGCILGSQIATEAHQISSRANRGRSQCVRPGLRECQAGNQSG